MAENKINRDEPVALLKQFVADSFVVYMKSYAVHWNYHGPKFFSIHKLTEAQYEEQAEAVDALAERIRALGGKAPLSLADILAEANINELKGVSENQDSLIQQLYESNVNLAQKARALAPQLEELGDKFSHDMVVARIGAHEKAAWMLHSQLE